MMNYWQKQTVDQPLFGELLWSRPENRRHAGKLGIVGGNSFGFSAVGEAYHIAVKAGAGTVRVLLPQAIQKIVGSVLAEAEFAPNNPSGSFSQAALAEFLDMAAWSDAVLVAGDLGRNSETSILLEKFVQKYSGPLVITEDAVDYFTKQPAELSRRQDTTLVLNMAQLQKLAANLNYTQAFTFGLDLIRLVEILHDFTTRHRVEIIVKHLGNVIVAVDGQVSTTALGDDKEIWRVETAARAAVWRMQNPSKVFEALSTAVIGETVD